MNRLRAKSTPQVAGTSEPPCPSVKKKVNETSTIRRDAEAGLKITITDIYHAFLHGENPVTVLSDIDLTIPAGQFVALIGPSGCGKTTLLEMLGGLIAPSEGSVCMDGVPVRRPHRHTAYMLARDALFPWRTAKKNVELGLELEGLDKQSRDQISKEWLQRVNLANYATWHVHRLSQGMRQRVAIARTLATSPRCVLMDEPFAALDAQTRTILQQEFLGLWEREQPTVVLVTHDVTEAVLLSDRVIIMSRQPGRIVADVPITMPRPRSAVAPLENDTFRDLCREIEALVRAQMSFSPGAVDE